MKSKKSKPTTRPVEDVKEIRSILSPDDIKNLKDVNINEDRDWDLLMNNHYIVLFKDSKKNNKFVNFKFYARLPNAYSQFFKNQNETLNKRKQKELSK